MFVEIFTLQSPLKLHQPAVPMPISKSERDPRRKWALGRIPIMLARVQLGLMALGAAWISKPEFLMQKRY